MIWILRAAIYNAKLHCRRIRLIFKPIVDSVVARYRVRSGSVNLQENSIRAPHITTRPVANAYGRATETVIVLLKRTRFNGFPSGRASHASRLGALIFFVVELSEFPFGCQAVYLSRHYENNTLVSMSYPFLRAPRGLKNVQVLLLFSDSSNNLKS